MSIVRGVVAPILGMALAATPAAADWADWILEAGVAFEATDNLNNSSFAADEESDSVWLPGIRGGRVLQTGRTTRWTLVGEARGEIYDEFDRANAVEGGVRIALLHKFGVGDKPWLRGSFYGGYRDVRMDPWSGRVLEVAVETGKRYSPRIDVAVGYVYTDRDGDEWVVVRPEIPTDVFDRSFHELTASGNFQLTRPLLLSAAVTLRDGDFISACTSGNIAEVLARETLEALSRDGVFGGCIYRIDGDGVGAALNLSYGFSDHLALDLGYRYRKGEGDSLEYTTKAGRLTLLYRY